MGGQIKDSQLNDIIRVCTSEEGTNSPKAEILKIIEKAWDDIYTVTPRTSFFVGLGLLTSLFVVEISVPKDASVNIDVYKFLVLLGGGLTAAAFSAGFTGTLNINLKWLQAGSAFGVFVLVFLLGPSGITGKDRSPDSGQQSSFPFSPLWSSAYADDKQLDTSGSTAIKPVGYIKIVYPRGVNDLRATANTLKQNLRSLSKKTEVWWIGTWVSWVTNQVKYSKDQYWFRIVHRPGITSEQIDAVKRTISDTVGYEVNLDQEDILEDFIEPDIKIDIKLL